MTTAEIKLMSQTERLRLMEDLWDAICHDVEEPPSPAWHEDVLKERMRKIDAGEEKFLTLDEVKQRLRR